MTEIYKPLKDYENLYEISNYGNVKSIKNNKLKSICNRVDGYISVSLFKNNKLVHKTIHNLVANNLYDLLRWTYIMTIILGVDADSDFSIVHESNMSKLCSTKEDAIKTVSDYKIKYIAGVSPYDSPYYYYLPNLNKWIVKNLSTGKALKNINYKKVSFANSRFVF